MSKQLTAEFEILVRQKAKEYSDEENLNTGYYDGYKDGIVQLIEAQERIKALEEALIYIQGICGPSQQLINETCGQALSPNIKK